MTPLFDSHTHLDSPRYDADREEVLARARAAGVAEMLVCGVDLAGSERATELAAAHEGLYATVGVHPHEARTIWAGGEVAEASLARLRELAERPTVVALGELGLDYHYDHSPRAVQCAVLAHLLTLAADLELPVVIHAREATDDLRRIVDEAPHVVGGVLHCFSGGPELAAWAVARGWYLGVAGPVTFRNAQDLRRTLTDVPLERVVIETDCPYLAPHPYRGRRNEPAYVLYVAEALAALRGVPLEALAQQTTANARRLLRLP